MNPGRPEPYIDACDCYDIDLNIPPVGNLIEFVTSGLDHVQHPGPLYKRLSNLYHYAGDQVKSDHYRRLAEEGGKPGGVPGT
jgi:hypothetical protein